MCFLCLPVSKDVTVRRENKKGYAAGVLENVVHFKSRKIGLATNL